ncbi:MAG: M23 family metallopeptidase [Proteobacteria bacterium]|nr:M23 family metallopeptidase [Pseudomonadota bacterium]MBU1738419.1 M23 family metallopeptidase [Pseudomonadota bacterium]
MIRNQIIRALESKISFNSLMPGDEYCIILNPAGQMVRCIYERNPLESYTIKPSGNGYTAEKNEILIESRTIKISGIVDTSLFTAFPSDIKNPRLVFSFADIFASKIDFNTETRSGDKFSLIVEEYYKFDEFIGYGPIQAALYERADGQVFKGFLYDNGTRKSYFDPEGNELGASFIKSPVQIGRITSQFSNRRLHPILGVIKKHLGVDLAAPKGTPVMASADGKVEFIGTNGGFGKQIVLSHGGNYRTHYGHLSNFRAGLKVGSRVRQKQIIGYVGSTGLATGPHLDYRLQHQGVYKNPFAVKFRPRSILQGDEFTLHSENVASLTEALYTENAVPLLHVETMLLNSDQVLSLL